MIKASLFRPLPSKKRNSCLTVCLFGNRVHAPWPYVQPFSKALERLTGLDTSDKVLGVELDSNRIFQALWALYERVNFLIRLKVVVLRLQHVPIRVLVVDARLCAVVRAPERLDTAGFRWR